MENSRRLKINVEEERAKTFKVQLVFFTASNETEKMF